MDTGLGRDPRTGRPLAGGREAIESLSDEDLELELTIAASAPDHLKSERYAALLNEKKRRRAGRDTPSA
jgi:hypothetical protein